MKPLPIRSTGATSGIGHATAGRRREALDAFAGATDG
jgi:hypothetical protein